MVGRIIGIVHDEGLHGLDRFVANYALGILKRNREGMSDGVRPRVGIELPQDYKKLASGRPAGKDGAFWIKVAKMLEAGGADVVCIDSGVAASRLPVSGIARIGYMIGMWFDQFTTHTRDKALMEAASPLEISLMGAQHAEWAKSKDHAVPLTLIEPPKELTTAFYRIQCLLASYLGGIRKVNPDQLVVVNW